MKLLCLLLSSQVRAEIFGLLFDGNQKSIHLRELQRRTRLSIGTIQREIRHLQNLDLITSRRDGNRLYFAANQNHPLHQDICSMVDKTSGIPQKLKQMLASFKKIECAFIFGSFAKGVVKSHSDIDLIIIGDVGLRALSSKLKGITDNVQREINPHIYSRFSWNEKLRRKDHFIRSVSKEPKLFLVGDENVLG